VSPNGNGTDGSSWAKAFKDTSSIDWSSIPKGATIYLDGGSSRCPVSPYDFAPSSPNPGVNCGTRYSPFTIGQDDVTILRSTDAGHDGTVVIDGGRDTPLPYCGQKTYSAAKGAAYGIDLDGHTGVVIDGQDRSGIVVRGAQNGVNMGTGGHDTLRNMELFDNGYPTTVSGGYNSDGNDILLNGANNTYDRLLVHDGGQDEVHSYASASSEAGSDFTNSWFGAMREDPLSPGEPFNDDQVSGSFNCTHADGVQIFAPGSTMSGLTFDHDVFGPGVNQGLYPSDGGTGTTFNNVAVSNTLFLDVASHNFITDNAVKGWSFDHVTIFATQGGSEIPGDGTSSMTSSVKYGGYWSDSGTKWTDSADIWYGGDSAPGSQKNPDFASAPTGSLPGFAALRSADLTPTCSGCSGIGSPITSWPSLLDWIDSLNGGFSHASLGDVPAIGAARLKLMGALQATMTGEQHVLGPSLGRRRAARHSSHPAEHRSRPAARVSATSRPSYWAFITAATVLTFVPAGAPPGWPAFESQFMNAPKTVSRTPY